MWSQVAKAQLKQGLVSDAIESFIKANDATQFLDVIKAAEKANVSPCLAYCETFLLSKLELAGQK